MFDVSGKNAYVDIFRTYLNDIVLNKNKINKSFVPKTHNFYLFSCNFKTTF